MSGEHEHAIGIGAIESPGDLSEAEKKEVRDSFESILADIYPYGNFKSPKSSEESDEFLETLGEKGIPYAEQVLFDTDELPNLTPDQRTYLFSKCVETCEGFSDVSALSMMRVLRREETMNSPDSYRIILYGFGRYIWQLRKSGIDVPAIIYEELKQIHEDKFGSETENEFPITAQVLELIALTGDAKVPEYIHKLGEKIPHTVSRKLNRLSKNLPDAMPSKYLQKSDNFLLEPTNSGEAELELISKKIDEELERITIQRSTVPLARIHLYNFITKNQQVTPEMIEKELKKISRWSQIEEKALGSAEIPTVGIEIEILAKDFNRELVTVLDICAVRHDHWTAETRQDVDTGYFEVNPEYTYSAFMQARILEELVEMGGIKLTSVKTADGTEKRIVPEDDAVSLHINLGIPPEVLTLYGSGSFKQEFTEFANLLTFAYVSPNRLYYRKTEGVYSQKSKDTHESDKSSRVAQGDRSLRLELRPFEARDKSTYQLILETQLLGAGLFAYLKYKKGIELSAKEYELVDAYEQFEDESKALLDRYQIKLDTVDRERYRAIELLQTTPVQEQARELVVKYASEIRKLRIDGFH